MEKLPTTIFLNLLIPVQKTINNILGKKSMFETNNYLRYLY